MADINLIKKETEEKVDIHGCVLCKDITLKDIKDFLAYHGYDWSGFMCEIMKDDYLEEYLSSNEFYFDDIKTISENFSSYIRRMILLGNIENWKTDENFQFFGNTCVGTLCNNNPFVRYIYFNVFEFNVHKVLKNTDSDLLTTALEKNLSKEWIQFLTKRKINYDKKLVKLCALRRQESLNSLEYQKNSTEIEKRKLDEELKTFTKQSQKQIQFYDQTVKYIEELNSINN